MAIDIQTHNYSITRNTSGGRATPKYIVLHYTATDGAPAINEVMYFALNPDWQARNGSADFFVDDTSIWQYNTQLDSRYSWAVGVDYSGGAAPYWGKCTNANSISIEMCCTYDGVHTGAWYISEKTYANAVELTKYLMQKYKIPAANVIRHWDVCRKPCPGAVGWVPKFGEATWTRFKSAVAGTAAKTTTTAKTEKPANTPIYRVRRSANDAKSQIGAFTVLANAKKLADSHAGYSVYDGEGKCIYSPSAKRKTVPELAKEVIDGKWGNGAERKRRLEAAGYNYATVQAEVNRILRQV